jgi:hypothetical protein
MGSEVTTQETQATATPEETELNKLMLERTRASQGNLLDLQENASNLMNQLLLGQELPGYLSGLPGGLDEEAISNLVGRGIEDVNSFSNQQGLIDSGTRQELGVKTASNIRADSARFNIQNLSQLLNLGVGGQAGIQQPQLQQEQFLGSQLAGLRSSQTTLTQMNPFLKSFQTSLGSIPGQLAGNEAFFGGV